MKNPVISLTLRWAVIYFFALGTTEWSRSITYNTNRLHNKQWYYTMFHKMVKSEKIPIKIRTDPRLFKSHTTEEIFKVFRYAFNTFTRMKNQLDIPAVAPRPQKKEYRFLYSIIWYGKTKWQHTSSISTCCNQCNMVCHKSNIHNWKVESFWYSRFRWLLITIMEEKQV